MSGPNYDGRYGETNGTPNEPLPCEECGEPASYGLRGPDRTHWLCPSCALARALEGEQ